MLFANTQHDPTLFGQVASLLDNQLAHLETLPLDDAEAASILRCRISLSDMLYKLTRQLYGDEKAEPKHQANIKAKELFTALKTRWKQWLIN